MESERQTRKKRIDPLLKGLGWKIVPFNPGRPLGFYENCAIEEYPTDNGPADYALCVHGQIVSVIEAKKVTLGPQNVLTQAHRYSRGLRGGTYNFDGHYVPFLYSTNGEVIWFHDVRHQLSRSRKINQFHTPAALREMLERDFDTATGWLETLRMITPGSGRTRSRRTPLSRRPSPIASGRCSSRWRPAPARPSRW